jgi:hypothetical protein
MSASKLDEEWPVGGFQIHRVPTEPSLCRLTAASETELGRSTGSSKASDLHRCCEHIEGMFAVRRRSTTTAGFDYDGSVLDAL